jgi:hypothetical protein
MITNTPTPLPGSVFSPTTMRDIEERFVTASMRTDVPPCEYVEATFDGVVATVEDLGAGDDGRIRRECLVRAGGVVSEFGALEEDGFVPDGSLFGSRTVEPRTIERIRLWSIGHGMPDLGPARSS